MNCLPSVNVITPNTKIGIAICSRGRPESLRRLLTSLNSINEIEKVNILLVENDVDSNYFKMSKNFKSDTFNLYYFLEKKVGIPFARNRALDEAARLQCEWLAFVDDDCITTQNWLIEMKRCANKYQADVVQGHWIFTTESGQLKVTRRHNTPWTAGQELEMASTSSVLFNLSKLHMSLPSLRFDEALKDSGGSDSKFFYTCSMNGWKIISCPESIVYEYVSETRLSTSWALKRRIRESYINFMLRFKNKEFPNSKRLMLRFIWNQVQLVLAVLIQSLKKDGKTAENSGIFQFSLEIATLIGYFMCLLGVKIRKYV